MPNITTYKSCYHATICLCYCPQKVCNFLMKVFQIKLKYHCSKSIKLQKFLMQQYHNAITNNLIVATQAFITRVIKSETSLSYSFCSILLQNMAHVFVVRDSLLQKTFNLTVENSYVAFLNHTTSSRTCSLYAGQGIPDLITLSAKDFKESFPSLLL